MCKLFCLHVCKWTACFPGAHWSQKRAPEPQELGLQMRVNHYVYDWN